ncbi:MAG: sodium-dependent dicarboxylate transporter 2/3/5 [Planctomycetota bacterium]
MSLDESEMSDSHASDPKRLARLGLILGPMLFLLLLLLPGIPLDAIQRRVAAVTALTATWWITAALPIGATSLIPAALFPLLGVLGAKEVAPLYMKDLVFLFLGAFVIALGLQRWGVHKRFALWTIARLGTRPTRLVLGFMVASAFLSFWINNTSTTLLMLPIGVAVIAAVRGAPPRADDPFAVALLLGMAYSASVGGIATPVGTVPNQVLLGQLSLAGLDTPSFGEWMLAWVPVVFLYLPLGWLLLTRVVLKVRNEGGRGNTVIRAERAALGSMGRGEILMTIVFVMTALLWVTRAELDLGFVRLPGWVDFVAPSWIESPRNSITDATVATTMAVLCFLIPVDRRRGIQLMDWKTASRMPWEVLLLIGAGFAIAGAFKESGLDRVLGEWLGPLISTLPLPVTVVLVVVFMVALTEITSNTATTIVLLPVLRGAAEQAGIAPEMLMLPATIAASAAFMLPVATPPNAVVFGSGLVPIPTMARVGLVMNLLLAILVPLVFLLWGSKILVPS